MKKLLIIAAAALLAAACAKTYEVKETTPPAIGFGTWTETLTKARAQGSNAFANGDSFAVTGYKTTGSTKAFAFDNVFVSTSDGTNWTYSPARYWDTNADSYTFFAVSPATDDNTENGTAVLTASTTTDHEGEISTPSAVTFHGNDCDLLVASKVVVAKGTDQSTYFNGYSAVNMVFNHVASLVDVKVKKAPALADATVSVSALALENIANVGTLSITSYSASTTSPATNVTLAAPVVSSASWTSTASTTYSASIASATAVAPDSAFPGSAESDTPASATDFISNLIVMPQVFGTTGVSTSQKLTLTYSIAVTGGGTNTYTGTLYLADFDKIDNEAQASTFVASWEPGKHYTFYVTIGARAITFTAEINPWDATIVNGYHYLVN